MVHNRDEPDFLESEHRLDQRHEIGKTYFASQVHQMIGAQRVEPPGSNDGVQHLAKNVRPRGSIANVADGDSIQDRCDAGGGYLGVMGQDCRYRGPTHTWSRRKVFLHIVGMEFHKTREQIVAIEIYSLS